jgi:hypothetical protein
MPTPEQEAFEREQARARRVGWSSLCAWATLGLALEGAHAFKISGYLDDELARMLLRLGHAHGVLLACVCLLFASNGAMLVPGASVRRVGGLLYASAWLMPAGFALAAFGHSESDPGIAIFLVPIGALCLLSALARIAYASFPH